MKKTILLRFVIFLFAKITMVSIVYASIVPNVLISREKSVYTSAGTTTNLNDGKFKSRSFNVTANSWIAINLTSGYNKVFISWNNPNHSWSDVVSAASSCKRMPSIPIDYIIQASSNSTNGANGQWRTVATIKGNVVTSRGHVVNLNGTSWIKMSISNGGGPIDEIEVFDLKNNGTDLWFFPGTSITAYTHKEYANQITQNFAELIRQKYPNYNPAMIRGGIGCINSTTFKNDIQKYMTYAGNVKFWAIEIGTNDAWGGSNARVATFKSNMQTIITSCKNAGIQPILARMIATNPTKAKWQVHPDYLKAIDDLIAQNGLSAGPDLYNWFLNHPGELRGDGIHPTSTGAASIQRLWAEKVASLYVESASREISREEAAGSLAICYPNPFNYDFKIKANGVFYYTIFDKTGKEAEKGKGENITTAGSELLSGLYVVKVHDQQGTRIKKIFKN